MDFKARVYMQRPGMSIGEYLGQVVLEMRPVQNGKARFVYRGKIETGHIESVTPQDWDKIGAIPTLHVMQGE